MLGINHFFPKVFGDFCCYVLPWASKVQSINSLGYASRTVGPTHLVLNKHAHFPSLSAAASAFINLFVVFSLLISFYMLDAK